VPEASLQGFSAKKSKMFLEARATEINGLPLSIHYSYTWNNFRPETFRVSSVVRFLFRLQLRLCLRASN